MIILKVGYVPEHFSTPLHFAQTHGFFSGHDLSVKLIPFPSGTGHMVMSLEAGEIHIAIGLTEGWIAALGAGNPFFKLVGKYVSTPLCWAISAGAKQDKINSIADLKNGKLGISRIGSGSYVMGFVLADQQGWLNEGKEPFEFQILNDFKRLRDGVNNGIADAFMWEVFTSKKYYDSGEIRQIGEIYTPWPSWHIVAHTSLTSSTKTSIITSFLSAVNEGIAYFNSHHDEAVEFISTNLDYSADDARAWLKTVRFSEDCKVVESEVVEKTVDILTKAGVINAEGGVKPGDMVSDVMMMSSGVCDV